MATYNPPMFPRRPKQSTIFSDVRYGLELTYYRYEINTALYVMSPGEKIAYNFIVLLSFALFLGALYYCLPSTVRLLADRLAYYFIGSTRMDLVEIASARVLQNSGEAMASLRQGGDVMNASVSHAI